MTIKNFLIGGNENLNNHPRISQVSYSPKCLEDISSIEDLEREELRSSKYVVLNWKTNPKNLFYLGMAFAAQKILFLANYEKMQKTPNKSFDNVLIYLHEFFFGGGENSEIYRDKLGEIGRIYGTQIPIDIENERRIGNERKIERFFLISPVRMIKSGKGEYIKETLSKFDEKSRGAGYVPYIPLLHTNQLDNIGIRICKDNREDIRRADIVLFLYNDESRGSVFDAGMAAYLKKPLLVLNYEDLNSGNGIENVVKIMYNHNIGNYREEFLKIKAIYDSIK